MDNSSLETTLEYLTEEVLNKAFDETLKEFTLDKGKFVRLTSEYHNTAKEVACHEFETREALSLATGLKWSGPFASDFWTVSLKQNLSLGIVDKGNNEIMAMRAIRWQDVKDGPLDVSQIEDEATKTALTFLGFCINNAKVPERFPTKDIFHFMGLIVPEKYSHQGLATKIMEFSIAFMRNLKLEDIVIQGETSSPYSQRVYEKLGFERLFHIPFDDYVVDGKQVLKSMGEPKTLSVFAMRLRKGSIVKH